jgi:imidazoleglycerol phosphate dehydratase HisB
MGISREIRRAYFNIPRTEAARSIAATFSGRPYIVVHEQSSVKTLPIVEKLKAAGETRLILDLNRNQVDRASDPLGHDLAELVVNLPLVDYTYLMEGAEELHMIESSIYCMTSHLDLSKVKRRVCYEPWGGNAERLGVFETGTI